MNPNKIIEFFRPLIIVLSMPIYCLIIGIMWLFDYDEIKEESKCEIA